MVINVTPEEIMWFVNRKVDNANLQEYIKPSLRINKYGEYILDLRILVGNSNSISKNIDENSLCNLINLSLMEIEKLIFDILKNSAQHSELDFFPNENNLKLKVKSSNILPQGHVLMNYKDTMELDRLLHEKYGHVTVLGKVKSFKDKNK